MADSKLSQITHKLKIPKFLVPSSVMKQTEAALVSANIHFSATEWMGIFTVLGLQLLIVATVISSILIGIILFGVVMVLMIMIPQMQADKRRSEVEAALPDALHHMSVAIKTGLVLESVIQEIADAEYGALSEEFSQVIVEMRRGRPLKDALLTFSKRTGSKSVERAMRLLLEGVESGGPISDVLEEVSDDIRSVRMIQRERRTATSQQISFLAMASLMAGPFVMGVVGALPVIMKKATAGIADMPTDEIEKVVVALTFYVVAQAASAGIMMGVVMYGDFKKGMKYMIPMGLIAYIVFWVVKKAMPSVTSAF